MSELQFFKRNNQKYRGEQIEINLIEHQWHNYDKQIMVFAFSPKDILKNANGEEVLKKPKYKIITRGFRYDMLKRVFNGINYVILDTTPTTQAQRNQYNEVSAKVQKLKDMVNALNRLHADNEPMFVHYKLDTRARIEHFFAQCYVEVGGSAFRLEERLSYSIMGLMHTFSYYQANKERIKEALNDGRATKPSDYAIKDILSNAPSNAIQAIKDLVQDHINFCLNLLPKTNGATKQKTNTTEIEKTLGIESKKKFDSKKAYSPIELIESFTEYQSYPTIQLAFRHSTISLAQGANYEIPYSTESHKAFILIAQAIANRIVNKRSDKKAKDAIIANKVYGGKYGNAPYDPNLTDQTQGDGYKYRGKDKL
ncbi:hypothetical protein [Helicobacter equorum]|uniref:Uncharacterized protein n=1 Tax=Helicobacter equorum TaxID=361872 RepID=A0A3D8IMY4_9HELI|nr:hypothetical protein [Helicobacter equorum]RDU66572.1 hypothetical protein CQA54_06305 [Helicobacter equorum]